MKDKLGTYLFIAIFLGCIIGAGMFIFNIGTVLIVQDRFGDNRNNGCDWYIESEKRCFDKGVWTEENVKVVLPE